MKNYIIALFLLISCFACKNDTKTSTTTPTVSETSESDIPKIADGYKIIGTILNSNDEYVYLHKSAAKEPMDSCLVVNDRFQFSGKVSHPDFYSIRSKNNDDLKLVIDNTILKILFTKKKDGHEIASTSPLLQQYAFFEESLSKIHKKELKAYKTYESAITTKNSKKLTELSSLLTTYKNAKKETIKDFISNSSDSYLSLLILNEHLNSLDFETVKSQFHDISKELKSGSSGTAIADFITRKEADLAAKKAAVASTPKKVIEYRPSAYAFSGKTLTGSQLSLADVSQGNVVLIDFWASWCQPCRAQNPHIVNLYRKYQNQGFKILSVSEDQNETAWQQAIKTDNLTWKTHILDNNKSIAFRYGISAIPHTILIDKKGKIAAEKLSGQRLEQKIKELLAE